MCRAVFVFVLFATHTACAQEPQAGIRRVLDEQAAAWNKADLEGFMKGYWNSPKLSFFSGNGKTAGWQATLDRYRQKYQTDKKDMGKLAFSELSIDMLGAEFALVKGRYTLTLGKEAPTGLFTLLVRKLPEGWRIIHDHTSN